MTRIREGMLAPDFEALSTDDVIVMLSDFVGKKIVLFFCLKAFTPVCTEMACLLRESFKAFENEKAVILWISTDNLATLKRFKREYNLPYYCISDSNKKISKLYRVLGFMGLYKKRTTFVIDRDRKIIKIIVDKHNIIEHIEGALNALS